METLFREEALKRLGSQERFDQRQRIVRPAEWLALLVLGGIVAGATAWAIAGRIPVTVSGRGLLVVGAECRTVVAAGDGLLASLTVRAGDRVRRGQVVATLDRSGLGDRQGRPGDQAAGPFDVTCPADGVVREVQARIDTLVRAGQPLLLVKPDPPGPDGARRWVKTYIPGLTGAKVRPGLPARVFVSRAAGGGPQPLAGRVERVAGHPESPAAVRASLGTGMVADAVVAGVELPLAVEVSLPDRPAPSGPGDLSGSDLPCTVEIVLEETAPWRLLLGELGPDREDRLRGSAARTR